MGGKATWWSNWSDVAVLNDQRSNEELVNKAFQLAGFILRDREAALQVVTRALLKLEVAVSAQYKRLYYRPIGRLSSRGAHSSPFRNIVSFTEIHLLQRLIYRESEPYEVTQEQGNASAAATEEDLVVHFIKYLVGATIRRNSFYVTLGISRLLYSYSTTETMDIYYAVIQDPERVKDDYYYRSRKGILMQEVKERFGNLINICRGLRGEEKFQVADNQSRFAELVQRSLQLFTPWRTPCLIHAGINPISDGISSLKYKGQNEEDETEINRMHAVVHPGCFGKLLEELHFDAPDSRLAIPHFFQANDTNGKSERDERADSEELNAHELLSIKDALDDNARRRKEVHTGVLQIMVDEIERAQIDLNHTRDTRFILENDAELIEVRAHDGQGKEVLLAASFLTNNEDADKAVPFDASVILEGNQKISISVLPDLAEGQYVVDVSYREINSLRDVRSFLTQLRNPARKLLAATGWNDRPVLVPVLSLLFLALCIGVAIRMARRGSGPETALTPSVITQKQVYVPDEKHRVNGPVSNDSNHPPQQQPVIGKATQVTPPQVAIVSRQREELPNATPKPENSPHKSRQESVDDVSGSKSRKDMDTRSITGGPAAVRLSAVKKIYVETAGEEKVGESLRSLLSRELAGEGITLVENPDDADALLKLTVANQSVTDKTSVRLKLISARGELMWPKSVSGGSYYGAELDVVGRIVRDLRAAIEKAKQGQR